MNSWVILVFVSCFAVFGFSQYITRSNSYSDAVPPVLSFEDPSELEYFTYPDTSSLMTSSQRYKDGLHSLVWKWSPGDELTIKLGRLLTHEEAGIKFWVYRNQSSVTGLKVTLLDSTSSIEKRVFVRFHFSLNFTGWRAAWVSLLEGKMLSKGAGYNEVKFDAPAKEISSQLIFMDLLCFSQKISYQSRDQIVPPINGDIYSIKNTWQQTYKWSLVIPPEVNGTTPLSTKEEQQLHDLDLIEKRLTNWFANESIGPMEYKGNVKIRWEEMIVLGFQEARRYLKKLNITVSKDGVITGSPLFVRRSEFGNSLNSNKDKNKKLGDVANLVLFPLTVEYYFSKQPRTINDIAVRELTSINSLSRRRDAVRRITKGDPELTEILLSKLRSVKTPISQLDMRRCLLHLNQKKLNTILLLLEYIKDQGWTEGSAMGSLDHEMNNVGSGFMNSLFLLRKELSHVGKLDSVLKTMKWYNDFGEIYQSSFEYSGTTADRLRTIMIYRLYVILMSRGETVYEKRAKLRDITAHVRWCNNALQTHPAFLAMFKPDQSCFHHLGIYGPSYTPSALTKASMLYYLYDGTSFSLSTQSRENIRKSLLSYQRIAVKYSLPNSISGRFPNYFKPVLTKMLPAYAFLIIRPQNLTNTGKLQEVLLGKDTEMIKVFLRLYNPENLEVLQYLQKEFYERVTFISSIGSLQILQAIYKRAKEARMQAAAPETGHWVHNFAALSIHRRKLWAVTVKGFSHYVWDYETGKNENLYGLYQSHGALQISNSEESLQGYNVKHGWDWTRVPGTTTIRLRLSEMIQTSMRNYQHSKLVGGVSLTSKNPSRSNGVFAMRFQQPLYGETADDWELDMDTIKRRPDGYSSARVFKSSSRKHHSKKKIDFTFRKSVFFYNSLVICLGSDINVNKSEPYRTQTTLFQDKMVHRYSNIYINGKAKWLRKDYTTRINGSVAILDTNGNGYYIPEGYSVNVIISKQTSRTNSGQISHGVYAVVWLDHGVNPISESYEYAILVSSDIADIEALKAAQSSHSPRYEVLMKNTAAHVVRFAEGTASPSATYGYVFFNKSAGVAKGPVKGASAECIIMAEVDGENFSSINMSISSPDLNYNATKVLNTSNDNGVNEFFYMKSQPVTISVYLRISVSLQGVLVNGNPVGRSRYGDYVIVKSHGPQQPSEIVFKNLVNGEILEVHLTVGLDLQV